MVENSPDSTNQTDFIRCHEHHSFDVGLASELGSVNLAILVHHFQYWINLNKRKGINDHDGRTWTYQTRKDLSAHFPYWSADQCRRLTDQLIKKGILIKGSYNKKNIDKTLWYAFKNEDVFTIGRSAKWIGRSATPLPDDITTNTSISPPPVPSPQGVKDKGKYKYINKSTTQVLSTSCILGPDACKKKIEIKPKKLQVAKKSQAREGPASSEFLPYNLNYRKEELLARKYGLSTEQEKTLDWLCLRKDLNTKTETLCWWAKNYSRDRIEEVYAYAVEKTPGSHKRGAYVNTLLKGEVSVKNNNYEENARIAEEFKKKHNWHNMIILKKYLKIKTETSDVEIPFCLDPKDFARMLEQKHMSFVS